MRSSQTRIDLIVLAIWLVKGVAVPIIGNDILVVLPGSQNDLHMMTSLKGFLKGVGMSGNAFLTGGINDIKNVFLSTESGGLFANDKLIPQKWMQDNIEIMKTKVVVSVGDGSAAVDAAIKLMPTALKPAWHLKCLQSSCPTSKTSGAGSETCVQFKPPAARALEVAGKIKPQTKKVVIINDGSTYATSFIASFNALTAADFNFYCGGCTFETKAIATVAALQALPEVSATFATANDVFLMVPSIEKIGSAGDVWNAIKTNVAGELVPEEVMKLGGLAAMHQDYGVSAQNCGLYVAGREAATTGPAFENTVNTLAAFTINSVRGQGLGLKNWLIGTLFQGDQEQWNPTNIYYPPSTAVVPKVLCAHAYDWNYPFTTSEHVGFIRAMRAAGWLFHCPVEGSSCSGDVDIHIIYWRSKKFFGAGKKHNNKDMCQIMSDYTKEYIDRWKPAAVYGTDDNVLKYLTLQCFAPQTVGPNPTLEACSKTQYVIGGINKSPFQDYADKCIQVKSVAGKMVCDGDGFFLNQAPANLAICDQCTTGAEDACETCDKYYAKDRSVNITIHLEKPDVYTELKAIKGVKPSTRKIFSISDISPTSAGSKRTWIEGYTKAVKAGRNFGITTDFVKDWHAVATVEEYFKVLASYQDKPEYFAYFGWLNVMLPASEGGKQDVYRRTLTANKLGEMFPTAYFNGAGTGFLLGGATRPQTMGRVAAEYTDKIIRNLATAATLPIAPTAMSAFMFNADRAKQLKDYNILAIPGNVLALGEQVYRLCGPGQYRKDGSCAACPKGTFKSEFGDSQELCSTCYSKNGFSMTTSGEGNTDNSACLCPATTFQQSCTEQNALATAQVCCRQCPKGQYQPLVGQTSCTKCGPGLTTLVPGSLTSKACLCGGSTYRLANSSKCEDCPEGMQCLVGSVEPTPGGSPEDFPTLLPGYYATKAEPLSVYICDDAVNCPGGYAGVCAGGRIALACSRCPKGSYYDGGVCELCGSTSAAPLVILMVIGFLGVLVVHSTVNKPIVKTSKHSMTAIFLGGMVATTVLTFNVYAGLDNVWSSPLSDFFDAMKVFAFDFKTMRFGCLFGTDRQIAQYAVKIAAVPAGLAVIIVEAFICSLVPPLKEAAHFTKHELFNSAGLIFSTLFIAVSLISLAGFQCSSHPNDKSTLAVDFSIVCWESNEHTELVGLSILAILMYPVGFLAITGMCTLKYHDWTMTYGSRFVGATKFLVARMTPECYYFGFWFNVRNFAITLAPIVAANNYGLQVFLMVVTFLSWLIAQQHFAPWRFAFLNIFDVFTTVMHILMLVLFSLLFFNSVRAKDSMSPSDIGWIIIVLFSLTLILLFVGSAYKFAEKFLFRKMWTFFLSHHKVSAGLHSRRIKMRLQHSTKGSAFLDVDDLMNLDNIGFTVRSSTDNLLVLLTAEILGRFWCAVEIATAYSNNVNTMVMHVSGEVKKNIADDVSTMWSKDEFALYLEVGVRCEDIEVAYRALVALHRFNIPLDAGDDVLQPTLEDIITQAKGCEVRRSIWAPNPETIIHIVYDTTNLTQCCVGHIFGELCLRNRWNVKALKTPGQLIDKTAVSLVMISKNLIGNPLAVGYVCKLWKMRIPCVSAISQEEFWQPSEKRFAMLAKGKHFNQSEQAIFEGVYLGSNAEAANAMWNVYCNLAWRVNPEGNHVVMNAQFKRILEKIETEWAKPRKAANEERQVSQGFSEISISEAIENKDSTANSESTAMVWV